MSATDSYAATKGLQKSLLRQLLDAQNPLYGVPEQLFPGYGGSKSISEYLNRQPAFQQTVGQSGSALLGALARPYQSVIEAQKSGDLNAALMSGIIPIGGMTVYHGSPHIFDKFKTEKIGTGEGAQAYGHGLYFAENPRVAKGYSTAGIIGAKGVKLPGRVAISRGTTATYSTIEDSAVDALTRFDGDKRAAIEWLDDFGRGAEARKWINGNIKGETAELVDVGSLYHVDIPDEQIGKMLDWDKPLSEQPESVRKALEAKFRVVKEADTADGPWVVYFGDEAINAAKTRKAALAMIEEKPAETLIRGTEPQGRPARERVSSTLNDLGIPGIKYLDAGSRGAAEGTRNIVLFDENLAKIVKRE